MECDADTWGGYLTTPAVWQQIETVIADQDPELHPALAAEVIALAGFSLGLFFRITESTAVPTNLYPPPVIRSVIVQTQLARGLEAQEKKIRCLGLAPIPLAIVTGMGHANILAKALKLAEEPIDAQAIADAWVKNDAPAVDALSKDLKPYVP